MKLATFQYLLLAAPYCIHGYILDGSCLVPTEYRGHLGSGSVNLVAYNIENVMGTLQAVQRELLKTATSNPPLSAHSRLLMDNFFGKAFKDSPRRAKIMAKRIENLLIHTRDVAPLPDALPVNDVIIYCDLSRFGPGPHPAGGQPVANAAGGYNYRHPLGWYENLAPDTSSLVKDCNNPAPGALNTPLAWVLPKTESQPDIMQLCPGFLRHLLGSGGLMEQNLTPFIYSQQTRFLPQYETQHWGIVDSSRPPTPAQKALRLYSGHQQLLPAALLHRLENQLIHELTHTSFWAAYEGLVHAGDIKTGPSKNPYGYDNNIMDQSTSTRNANTIAYYAMAVKRLLRHGLLEDRLGMLKDVAGRKGVFR